MGTYAAQSDLTNRFGSVNIGKWSQLDPSQDNSTIDTARVSAAIDTAECQINEHFLNGLYQIPLVAAGTNGLLSVTRWTCALAAADLLKAKDEELPEKVQQAVDNAMEEIREVVYGGVRLNCALNNRGGTTTTAPWVVS